ncbi:MAG: DUF2808 domain-containing protein [Leptolyngbyaceae cyanobacterium]
MKSLTGLFLGTAIFFGSIAAHESAAVQLADGTVAFEVPPRLTDFYATRNRTSDRHSTYYFTLTLPEGAGEPLETLEIKLIEGRANLLRYHLDDTALFRGTPGDRGESIPLAQTAYDQETQVITIQLETPAQPGQDVTLAVQPVRNPRWEGVYLFEVVAQPAGELNRPHRAGIARLHIYDNDRDSILD